jgi:hypothetical protein
MLVVMVTACSNNTEHATADRVDLAFDDERATANTGESVGPPEGANEPDTHASAPEAPPPRTPERCPHAFEPSLTPSIPPAIHTKNSARRVQRVRERLERVEIVELGTHRVLFELDEHALESLRRTPDDVPFEWGSNSRTASLPAWKIALLFHVAGEPLPFLGHYFDDGQVYFVDGSDPWSAAVFDDNENFRRVFPIPTGYELDRVLVDRFGEHDPFGKVAWQNQKDEDARCGRVSQRFGDPFPHLPKASIEPAAGAIEP